MLSCSSQTAKIIIPENTVRSYYLLSVCKKKIHVIFLADVANCELAKSIPFSYSSSMHHRFQCYTTESNNTSIYQNIAQGAGPVEPVGSWLNQFSDQPRVLNNKNAKITCNLAQPSRIQLIKHYIHVLGLLSNRDDTYAGTLSSCCKIPSLYTF